jgi:hypothetical protein
MQAKLSRTQGNMCPVTGFKTRTSSFRSDLRLSCTFVNDSVLHDDRKIFTGIADQVNVG